MKHVLGSKKLLGLFSILLTTLGVNAVPAGVFFIGGWSAEATMLLYFFENILAIILSAICVRLITPPQDRTSTRPQQNRRALLSGYLVFSLGFSAASGVFLAAFIFLVLRTPISFSTIAGGMAGIAVFQLFGFGANLLLLRPLPIAQAEILLQQSMGRVALLYLAVFAGVCVAAFADRWFVIPFIALKAMVDIGGQVQGFNNLFRRNNSP